jgi:photosystem II stability/assembly factor-like uncharacterized protein
MRTFKRLLFLLGATGFPLLMSAQSPEGLASAFKWRNVGPANMGGRVVDIEAHNNDFSHVWMATASGGVWKSENAGTTWTPVFDKYETASIGDLAIFQANPSIVWVGTGEANNRNSTSWGNGVYKTTDGGKTFEQMGLENTNHISRIVTHPSDADEACICATGHLWGYSGDRGVFKTTDGGKNWEKLTNGLPDDGKTGCTDLVRDPSNPKIMYAAFYHRKRQPWFFDSGGEGGGIYKTTNGGKSWTKLTEGLPDPTGRIGLDIYRKNPKILVALIEAEQTGDLSKPGSGLYRSEDGGKSWQYINTYNNRPFYYSQVRINPHDDQKVYLLTTRFMVSDDGGKNLRNGSADEEVHGDFHAMWLDPNHEERYYLGADKGISITHDHGQHFTLLDNISIGQFYRIGVDQRDPYYIYGGLQDNGTFSVASFSRDIRGILNDSNWKLHWGDGQFIQINPKNWRKVFSSAENGSYYRYDALTHRIENISVDPMKILNYSAGLEFRFNWSAPLVMSPHNPSTLYVAGNHVFRSTDEGETWTIISPDLSTNDPVKRETGTSGGITLDNTGAEYHCSVTTLSISTLTESLIWAGTDDGNVQVTRDGGRNWTNVRANVPGVPEGIWVSRIEASRFNPAEAFLTFDGHRSDLFRPFVFKTSDYGNTWKDISANLPENEVVRVIRQDLKNPNLLFIGTETGVFASIDAGASWMRWMQGMPTVSVYDLVIHPRDNDLVAGTHGRSIWVMDDISPLQQLGDLVNGKQSYLFEQRQATLWENVSRGGQRGHFWFGGENPSTIKPSSSLARARFDNSAEITYYIGKQAPAEAMLTIESLDGRHSLVQTLEVKPGIHRWNWSLHFDAKAYTAGEQQQIKALLQKGKEYYASENRFTRAVQRYEGASEPAAQRRAIQSIMDSYPTLGIPEALGMPVAGPGVYKVSLKSGAETWTRNLHIRRDPLLTE